MNIKNLTYHILDIIPFIGTFMQLNEFRTLRNHINQQNGGSPYEKFVAQKDWKERLVLLIPMIGGIVKISLFALSILGLLPNKNRVRAVINENPIVHIVPIVPIVPIVIAVISFRISAPCHFILKIF